METKIDKLLKAKGYKFQNHFKLKTMNTIELKNGTIIEFEEFAPKASNHIKLNINDNGSDNGEGVWACVTDADKKDYNDDVTDTEYTRVAILRNSALAFYPRNTWGAYVPYKMNGTNRPILDTRILKTHNFLINKSETKD